MLRLNASRKLLPIGPQMMALERGFDLADPPSKCISGWRKDGSHSSCLPLSSIVRSGVCRLWDGLSTSISSHLPLRLAWLQVCLLLNNDVFHPSLCMSLPLASAYCWLFGRRQERFMAEIPLPSYMVSNAGSPLWWQ